MTGAAGRLGRALVAALADSPYTGPGGPIAWTRSTWDLDDPGTIGARLRADRPETVVHAAAWTDVDGCAREPELARRRNAEATAVLARACADSGLDLLVVSTNEVFDGARTDGQPYGPDDLASPVNAYGASKLDGERAAAAAYSGAPGRLGIARTSWLYGPPGNDFPDKILAAADRARDAGEGLRVVADEWGSPTYSADLAEAIVELIGDGDVGGVHHLVNEGVTTRAGWARELFRQAGIEVTIEEVPASTWQRASTPPLRAVLRPTPLPSGEPMRPWTEAMADYLPGLRRRRSMVGR
ncbi:MAG TPA: NAD(P)-dependent oxidoreductase [Vitreimonas sp.]|nr:NAD(P)-dependent oxidoreductase [Vitreimonas sp.]